MPELFLAFNLMEEFILTLRWKCSCVEFSEWKKINDDVRKFPDVIKKLRDDKVRRNKVKKKTFEFEEGGDIKVRIEGK